MKNNFLKNALLGLSVGSGMGIQYAHAIPVCTEDLIRKHADFSDQAGNEGGSLSGRLESVQSALRESCQLDWDSIIEYGDKLAQEEAISFGTGNLEYIINVYRSYYTNVAAGAVTVCVDKQNKTELFRCLDQYLCDEKIAVGQNLGSCKK